MFAWEKGKRLEVGISEGKKGAKIYKLNGILFFGSVLNFKDLFDPENDPDTIVIDLKYARVMDFSALEAIDSVAIKYKNLGKDCFITRPGENCRALLENAENITSIVIQEDENK